MTDKPKVLIVDDEKNIRETLAKILISDGWAATTAENGLSAQRQLQEEAFFAVIADLKMPGLDGLSLLKWCKQEGPDIPFLMISAHGEITDAVEAMKLGAKDYITKPFSAEEILVRLKNTFEAEMAKRVALSLKKITTPEQYSNKSCSPAWKSINELALKVAKTTALILITGESGTGKEVLAKRIHELSNFNKGPFVGVNLGALPENLIESELFGFERGAFTGADHKKIGFFEQAQGGTLFLDEIGELHTSLQVKLLRVLQERRIQRLGGVVSIPVEARILAATNKDLAAEVKKGTFREDLYYRLNVVPIKLPPLRERMEDLPWLSLQLIEKISRQMGKPKIELSELAIKKLQNYSFPGNIRELENLLERALILCEDKYINEDQFDTLENKEFMPSHPAPGTLQDMEKKAIEASLLKWEGNQTKAANELGISRRTLFNKIHEYKIESHPLDETLP